MLSDIPIVDLIPWAMFLISLAFNFLLFSVVKDVREIKDHLISRDDLNNLISTRVLEHALKCKDKK